MKCSTSIDFNTYLAIWRKAGNKVEGLRAKSCCNEVYESLEKIYDSVADLKTECLKLLNIGEQFNLESLIIFEFHLKNLNIVYTVLLRLMLLLDYSLSKELKN